MAGTGRKPEGGASIQLTCLSEGRIGVSAAARPFLFRVESAEMGSEYRRTAMWALARAGRGAEQRAREGGKEPAVRRASLEEERRSCWGGDDQLRGGEVEGERRNGGLEVTGVLPGAAGRQWSGDSLWSCRITTLNGGRHVAPARLSDF